MGLDDQDDRGAARESANFIDGVKQFPDLFVSHGQLIPDFTLPAPPSTTRTRPASIARYDPDLVLIGLQVALLSPRHAPREAKPS